MSVDIDVSRAPSCVANRTGDGRVAVDIEGGVSLVGTFAQLYQHVVALALAINAVATPDELAGVEPTEGDDR